MSVPLLRKPKGTHLTFQSAPAPLTVLLFMSVSSRRLVTVPSRSKDLRDMFWHTCVVKSIFCTCASRSNGK